MKILQIAPLVERIPPKKYGGTERVVYALTEELVKRGHDVTLFASGDSITSAKLVSVYPKSLREEKEKNEYQKQLLKLLNISSAYEKAEEYDIIHDHNGPLSVFAANMVKTPVVMTIHGVFTQEAQYVFERLKNPYLVSISKSQIKNIDKAKLNYIGNVYNGLIFQNYPFSFVNKGYLLFVGRICEEKGVSYAIEVAKSLKLPLIIAAKLESQNLPYFNKYVKPRLSSSIQWIGEVNETQRNMLMSKALCFLHPAVWQEPFGLTLIEAMATGCPVVAFKKGSIPEVIVHKKTGFIVSNIKEMIKAVKKIKSINRYTCRQYALSNFSAEKMTDGYERIYENVFAEKYNINESSHQHDLFRKPFYV